MLLGEYAKLGIVHYHSPGLKLAAITHVHVLAWEDGSCAQEFSVPLRQKVPGDRIHSVESPFGRPTKITPEIVSIVKQQMQLDDEITAVQLKKCWSIRCIPCLSTPFFVPELHVSLEGYFEAPNYARGKQAEAPELGNATQG